MKKVNIIITPGTSDRVAILNIFYKEKSCIYICSDCTLKFQKPTTQNKAALNAI